MSVTMLPTKEPSTGQPPSEAATATPIAVAVRQPLMYVFDLYRDGKYAGGGLIEAPSPTSAAQTVELTLAGGADVYIRGFICPRPDIRSAA